MDYGLQMSIQVLTLITGFALVLWGLRIVRLYVATLGFIFGGLIGGVAATFVFGSEPAALTGLVLGGIIGAVVAWPIQKLVVILAAGALGAALVATAAVAVAGADHVAAAAIGGFLVFVVAAAVLYDIMVIGAMALNGALLIFQAVFVPVDAWFGSPRQVARQVLAFHVDNIVAFVTTILLFTSFAMFYQRRWSRRRIAVSADPDRLVASRRIPFRLALITLVIVGITAMLAVAGVNTASSFELLGFHALSWPLVSFASVVFMRPGRITSLPEDAATRPRRRRTYLAATLFGLSVPPVLSAGLFALYDLNPNAFVRFYQDFALGDPATIAAKATLSFAVLPLMMMLAVPASVPRPAPKADDEAGPDAAPEVEEATPVSTPEVEETAPPAAGIPA